MSFAHLLHLVFVAMKSFYPEILSKYLVLNCQQIISPHFKTIRETYFDAGEAILHCMSRLCLLPVWTEDSTKIPLCYTRRVPRRVRKKIKPYEWIHFKILSWISAIQVSYFANTNNRPLPSSRVWSNQVPLQVMPFSVMYI